MDQAKKLNTSPSLDEKIELHKMTEEVLWADLDRYKSPLYDNAWTLLFTYQKFNNNIIREFKFKY